MNRIEKVREYVDAVLLNAPQMAERAGYYAHLYGVSQACALIALKRGEDAELAVIAGMLHDIHSFSTLDSEAHARKGAVLAREILSALQLFTHDEIETVCTAIHNHSNKRDKHSSFDEVLIDADVLQHCLYNPLLDAAEHEKQRYEALRPELGLP